MENLLSKLKKLSKKQLAIGVFILFLILGGGVIFAQQKAIEGRKAETTEIIKKNTTQLKQLTQQIQGYYLKGGYLKKTVTQSVLKDLEQSLAKQKLDEPTKAYNTQYQSVETALKQLSENFLIQTKINALFEIKTPVIVEKTVKKDGVIVDNLKTDIINDINAPKVDNEWSQSIETLKTEALNQVNQIESATKLVNDLFQDNKPQDNEAGYNQAIAEVNKIRNEASKKKLSDKLSQVKKVVDEANKKEAEAKQAVQKQEAEQAAASSGGTAVQGSDGSWSVQTSSGQVVAPSQAASGNYNSGSTSGNSSNTGNSSAGSATSSVPSTPSTPSQPSQPSTPSAPTIVAGAVGNSGMLFNSENEAIAWADSQTWNESSQWYLKAGRVVDVVYSDGSRKWTVDFHN
jgi:hypothetical protein